MDAAGVEPHYDLNVVLCTDEEIGGYPGVWHLAKEGYVKGHMLCLEGGQDPRIGLGSAGSVDVTITTIGQSGHSGANYKSINAVDAMLPIMNELWTLKQEVERRESEIPGSGEPEAPSKQMTPMFNFAIINAGVKSNIVPATCTLLINRRYIREERIEDIEAEIRTRSSAARPRAGRAMSRSSSSASIPPCATRPVRTWRRCRRRPCWCTATPPPTSSPRAAAARPTWPTCSRSLGWDDIPFSGPGRRDSRAHGADEFVRLEDVKSHIKMLIHYLAF